MNQILENPETKETRSFNYRNKVVNGIQAGVLAGEGTAGWVSNGG